MLHETAPALAATAPALTSPRFSACEGGPGDSPRPQGDREGSVPRRGCGGQARRAIPTSERPHETPVHETSLASAKNSRPRRTTQIPSPPAGRCPNPRTPTKPPRLPRNASQPPPLPPTSPPRNHELHRGVSFAARVMPQTPHVTRLATRSGGQPSPVRRSRRKRPPAGRGASPGGRSALDSAPQTPVHEMWLVSAKNSRPRRAAQAHLLARRAIPPGGRFPEHPARRAQRAGALSTLEHPGEATRLPRNAGQNLPKRPTSLQERWSRRPHPRSTPPRRR